LLAFLSFFFGGKVFQQRKKQENGSHDEFSLNPSEEGEKKTREGIVNDDFKAFLCELPYHHQLPLG